MTRKRIFNIIQIGSKEDFISRAFDIFIVATVLLNISALFMKTFDECQNIFPVLNAIELITVICFCIEYALRIWTADLLYPEKTKLKAIGAFLVSFDGIVDLLTILPFFYLSGFVAFRMLRVVRILHLFRINAKYDSFNVITTVLKDKRNQILSSLFIILVLMLAASIGIYSAEHEAQPEAYKNAFSGMWWAVSALLTVGYGDIYPITFAGKVMAIITAFLGVGVVAIPTGIMSAGFVEQYTKMKEFESVTTNSLANLNIIEKPIEAGDEWENMAIKDLDISRLTTIISIHRGKDLIIPHGNTIIKAGDRILIHSKHQ